VFLVAGSEPASTDQDPKFRSYLTWLEKESGAVAPAQTSPDDQSPVATAQRRLHRKQKRQRQKTAISAPAGQPGPAPVQEFDVELVPIPAPVPSSPRGHAGLCRRDFIAFGVGAGSVLIAILVGWLTAKLFGTSSADDGRR
jgi:hypothetical protein